MTPQPSQTNFSGSRGCAGVNAGVTFPNGNPPLDPAFNPQVVPLGAHIIRPANTNFGLINGLANPDFYATNNRLYRYSGIHVNNTISSRTGGTWTIKHTGSFSGNDFEITSADTYMRSNANFPVVLLPPGEFFTSNRGQYSTVLTQIFEPDLNDLGKSVPAMGAFGLASLLTGLCIIGWRALEGTLS